MLQEPRTRNQKAMIHLLSALKLVALAASLVSAVPLDREYDILNCTDYNMRPGTHNAYSNDCRRFYNCDNKGGGKLTNCAEGVLFNKESGVCDFQAKCDVWDREACFQGFPGQRNPSAIVNFPALCCEQYYEYKCEGDGTWTYKWCPPNQQFDPNTRQCSSQFRRSDCECDTSTPPPGQDPCKYTNLVYVDECHFRYATAGTGDVMSCAPGTEMSPTKCQCVLATSSTKCATEIATCAESRSTLDFQNVKFKYPGGMGYVGRLGFERNADYRQLTDNSYFLIYFFSGNNVGPESALSLEFSPDTNGLNDFNEKTILSTVLEQNTDTPCDEGTRVTVAIKRSTNGIQVIFRADGMVGQSGQQTMSAMLQGQVSSRFGGNPNIKMVVTVEKRDKQLYLSGRIRSNNQFIDMTGNNVPVTFFENTVSPKCLVKLGGFKGSITDFSFWRCPNAKSYVQNMLK